MADVEGRLAWRKSEQAGRRPQLVVKVVRLIEVEDVPDVLGEIDAIEEERQTDREEEMRKEQEEVGR
jgi:hypothetical protein